MFTDIEGSTRLLESLGDDYGQLLAEHHRIVHDLSEAEGGALVDTQGDGCFLAFPTASSAVRAATNIQIALAAHEWPQKSQVKVRVGVHTGSPVQMEGRYVGMDVHRAARISAVAHGGQVVASAPTVELAGDGHGWTNLGDYRLKDLPRPERIFQLQVPGFGGQHPPLKADRWGGELPQPPTRFVGRDADVEQILATLEGSTRLVTLVGPGGIGKTRLAVHVGSLWAERHPDSVEFVPLATLTDIDEVAGALASAVGITEFSGEDPLAVAIQHLRDRRVMLILDNLEHLLPAVGDVVAQLTGACPDLRVIATSRAPLRVSGERLIRVQGLTLPGGHSDLATAAESEAVSLFIDRARAVAPGFRLSPSNLEAVVEISRRLDGMPLALELAAARTAVLAPGELLDRLRLEILTGGSTDHDERQQTLTATIEWSYRLLDEVHQQVFRQCAVFAGGAGLDDLEAVIRADALPLDSVTSLVANSLVWRDEDESGRSRYRILEVVREFAHQKLAESGELPAVADRHAAHFAGLVQEAEPEIDGPDASEWMARLETEMPNIRAALRWTLEEGAAGSRSVGVDMAQALGWFWYIRGHAVEGLRWLAPARAAAVDAPALTQIRITYFAGALAERLGRFGEAVELFEQTLVLCRQAGDQMRTARALNSLGGMAIEMGDHDAATEYLAEAEDLLLATGDKYGLGANYTNQCDVALSSGDLDRARQLGGLALDLFAETENAFGEGVALRHLAKVAYAAGDLQQCRTLLSRALDKARQIGDQASSARCLERFGGVEISLGQHAKGLRLGAAAQRIRSETGDNLTAERRAGFERSWLEARLALGEDAARVAWDQGAKMTSEQAISYAIDG